jgi:hypothetical protein
VTDLLFRRESRITYGPKLVPNKIPKIGDVEDDGLGKELRVLLAHSIHRVDPMNRLGSEGPTTTLGGGLTSDGPVGGWITVT